MDLRLRADVHAARRLVEDENLRLRREPLAPARPSAGFRPTVRDDRIDARRAHAQPVEKCSSPASRSVAPIDPTSSRDSRSRSAATCCAARSPTARGPAACDPPARSRCRARSRARGRRCAPRVPRTKIVPRVGGSSPKSARATSERPAPTSPASPTTSPARSVNETSSKLSRRRQSLDAQQLLARRARRRARKVFARADGRSSSARARASASSAVGRVATCVPSRSTVTASHSAKISGMRCET